MLALATTIGVAVRANPTVEIAPGVHMPLVNLGGVTSKPSNYSVWLEAGGRGIDTALTYGPVVQTQVGKAIAASSLRRDQIFLTTKVPCCPQPGVPTCANYSSTPALDVESDLKQLGVDQVDLLLLHWPCETMEQTVAAYKALEPLVAAGKSRAIGISNFNSSAVAAIVKAATVKPSVNQCGFSIGGHATPSLGRDFATRDACRAHGVTYSAYSPLGGLSHIDVLHDPDVKAIAAAHSVSTAQVALRWVVQQGVVAVTASTNEEYDKEDLDVFSFALTDEEVDLLSKK